MWQLLGEQGELVIMRGEKRACADFGVQIFDAGPGEGSPSKVAVPRPISSRRISERRWRC